MEQTIILSAPRLDYALEVDRDPHLKSAHTKRQYKSALAHFEEWRLGRTLTLTLVEEYAGDLQKRLKSPNTINQSLAVIRWWARRVVKLAYEQVDPEQAERIAQQAQRVIGVENVTGSRQPRGRHLEGEELAELLNACKADPSPAGARDAALISTALVTGCRNEELRDATLDDIQYAEGGAYLTVQHGKGDKSRTVFLNKGSLKALDAWLDVRGAAKGPIFNPIRKNGKVATSSQLSYEGTRKILYKRFVQSGLKKSMTWHDFRRTLGGLLYDNGTDPSTIQEQFGHANYNTTKKYDRRPEARRRLAIESIEVPY